METARRCYELLWINPRSNTLQSNNSTATDLQSQKQPNLDEQDMRDTAGEAKAMSYVTFLYGPLRIDVPVSAEQLELIFINSLWTKDAV